MKREREKEREDAKITLDRSTMLSLVTEPDALQDLEEETARRIQAVFLCLLFARCESLRGKALEVEDHDPYRCAP